MTASKYSLDVPVATLGSNGFATTTGWLTTYNSDTITREYTSARQDYIQVGVGLASGAYTDVPTLPTGANKAVRRTADGKAWEIVADYRGQTAYSTKTGQPQPVDDMGDLSATLTLLAPQTPYDNWDGTRWVTDKEAQHAALVQEAILQKVQLMSEATIAIAPLQDAVDTGIATDEETRQLTAWKTYRALMSRINPEDASDIKWPDVPA